MPPNAGAPVAGADGVRYGELFGAPVPPGRGAPVDPPGPLDPPGPPGPPGRAPCCGRAAKPGRTEPGRAPDIGGRSPGLIGRAAAGLGIGGRGIAPPALNGLLPARGGRGILEEVVGDDGVEVDAEVGEVGEAGEAGTTGACGVATDDSAISSLITCASCAFASCSRVPSGSCASAASISSWVGAAVFLAAVFLAAAFLAGFGAASTGFISGNLSINLRTTGASTVDDAERTNSPTSCNLARSSLLSKPNSFANS